MGHWLTASGWIHTHTHTLKVKYKMPSLLQTFVSTSVDIKMKQHWRPFIWKGNIALKETSTLLHSLYL